MRKPARREMTKPTDGLHTLRTAVQCKKVLNLNHQELGTIHENRSLKIFLSGRASMSEYG